ncbi:MAG: hypothetical protein JJP05_00085 [cyanobacterium endosymbiont of Rhopalodia gibba]
METTSTNTEAMQENIQDSVAQLQLQLYMALHSRNLVPSLTPIEDLHYQLLRETQATIEKLASRQTR